MESNQNSTTGPLAGDGSNTEFNWAFYVADSSELLVYKHNTTSTADPVLQTLGVDYDIDHGAGVADGGRITMTTAPTSDEEIIFKRETTITQTLDLQNQGRWNPSQVESAFDKLTRIVQNLAETLARCLHLPVNDQSNDASLPQLASNKYVCTNSDGTGFALLDSLVGPVVGLDNLSVDGVNPNDLVQYNATSSTWESRALLDEDTMTSNSAAHAASQQSVKAYVDSAINTAITGVLSFQGSYDASAAAPDGTAQTGYMWVVTVAGRGGPVGMGYPPPYFSSELEVGDTIIAEVDNPTSESDWIILQKNIDLGGDITIANLDITDSIGTASGAAVPFVDNIQITDSASTADVTVDGASGIVELKSTTPFGVFNPTPELKLTVSNVVDKSVTIDADGDMDVPGNISVGGTVDGVDIQTINTTVAGHTTDISTNTTDISTNTTDIATINTTLSSTTGSGDLVLQSGPTIEGVTIVAPSGAPAASAQLTCTEPFIIGDGNNTSYIQGPVSLSGNLTTTGLVDGVDVSALNTSVSTNTTKLAGIESGATADQTGAEIKSLYEGEADTNAFTDSEKTKLSGIESSATADQTGAEIKSLYEAEADTNAFTDSEKAAISTNTTDIGTINTTLSSTTGSGNFVLQTSPTITTPTISGSAGSVEVTQLDIDNSGVASSIEQDATYWYMKCNNRQLRIKSGASSATTAVTVNNGGNTTIHQRLWLSNEARFTAVDTLSGTSPNINFAYMPVAKITLSGATTFTVSNRAQGTNSTVIITQGSSAHSVSWPSYVKWANGNAPDFTTFATSSVTIVSLFCYDGSNIVGTYIQEIS